MANGGLSVADIPGAVNRGLEFRQQDQLRPIQAESAGLTVQGQQQGLQIGEQNLKAGQQSIESEEQRVKSQNLFNTVSRLRSLPDGQKLAFIQQNIAEVEGRGGDAAESRQALALIQQGKFTELKESLDSLHKTGVETGFLKAGQTPKDAGFTLSKDQQRFDAQGNLIASGIVTEPEGDTEKQIPSVLLEGLDSEIAPKASAAFTAAGGGKDGLKAFQDIVDKGTELQRRLASPALIKNSFPNASSAETTQLQAAMDSAKTTEAGLKAAGKVREDQRRTKKAKAFQVRAVDLLSNILGNDELNDVLGAVEGRIDFRTSDSEAELIADIEEAVNILTADNMDLMTGVLSETGIKILKSLSGGGLNRMRTEKRFRTDVQQIIDKLSSVPVVTPDEEQELRDKNAKPITATGPNGEKIQFINGQWVPL